MSKVLFSSVAYARYDEDQTLPAKFGRMLEKSGLAERVKGKTVAIKMHEGDGTGYSTIPPVFIVKLVDFLKKNGANCFCTDHYVYKRNPKCAAIPLPRSDTPCWTTAAISASISIQKKSIIRRSITSMWRD